MRNLGSLSSNILHDNDLAANDQEVIAVVAISNGQILGTIDLAGVVSLGSVIGRGLVILAASISKIIVDLTSNILCTGGNLSQIHDNILALNFLVQDVSSLGQRIHNDKIAGGSITGHRIVSISAISGLAVGGLGVSVLNVGQLDRLGGHVLAGGISGLDKALRNASRESGGAQCQSHDHGQHSCNDLLHVCFLHKNLFVSGSASSSETAFTT